LNLLLLKI